MKKTLDTGSILNELQEGSAFFRRDTSSSALATPTTSKPPSAKFTKETQNRTVERNDRTNFKQEPSRLAPS